MREGSRLLAWLFIYAVAMAAVEAAVVVYLRNLYYASDPLHIFPLHRFTQQDLTIELVREVATLVMIVAVSFLLHAGFLRRFAALLFVFGCWDIFYYACLKLMIGWPESWLEWDMLFLIPWYWFAPWLTPVLIAILFVCWGAVVLFKGHDVALRQLLASHALPMALFVIGCALGLISFLLPALPLLAEGQQALLGFMPGVFAWYSYVAGFALMLLGLLGIGKNRG